MFRRSGSVSAWIVDGTVPDPGSPAFQTALQDHRFRTIERAASEEVSVGWVTPEDPTGDSFDFEDMDLDHAVWLRMRIDKKQLPATWVAIHRQAAEKSAGRRLNARERKDLKDDLMRTLLPRVLPAVRLIDALYEPAHRRMLLFGTSKSVCEEFGKLFFRSFTAKLIESDPYGLATVSGLDRERASYLEQTSPVRWPRAKQTPVATVDVALEAQPVGGEA